MVAGDVVNTAARLAGGGAGERDPRRRADLPRDRARDRVSGGEPVEAKGKAEPVIGLAGGGSTLALRRRRPAGADGPARRPRAGASDPAATRSRARATSARRSWSRSSVCRGSARAARPTSSSSPLGAEPDAYPGGRAAACPTARASASGRSPRWSRRRPGSSRPTRADDARRRSSHARCTEP